MKIMHRVHITTINQTQNQRQNSRRRIPDSRIPVPVSVPVSLLKLRLYSNLYGAETVLSHGAACKSAWTGQEVVAAGGNMTGFRNFQPCATILREFFHANRR
jgi:hypothetical protein